MRTQGISNPSQCVRPVEPTRARCSHFSTLAEPIRAHCSRCSQLRVLDRHALASPRPATHAPVSTAREAAHTRTSPCLVESAHRSSRLRVLDRHTLQHVKDRERDHGGSPQLRSHLRQWTSLCWYPPAPAPAVHGCGSLTDTRLSISYTDTMAVPHSAELAMRGPAARNIPSHPSSRRTSAATARNVMACPSCRRATCGKWWQMQGISATWIVFQLPGMVVSDLHGKTSGR